MKIKKATSKFRDTRMPEFVKENLDSEIAKNSRGGNLFRTCAVKCCFTLEEENVLQRHG